MTRRLYGNSIAVRQWTPGDRRALNFHWLRFWHAHVRQPTPRRGWLERSERACANKDCQERRMCERRATTRTVRLGYPNVVWNVSIWPRLRRCARDLRRGESIGGNGLLLGLLLFHVLPVRCFANKALPLELRLLLQAGAVRFVSKMCTTRGAACARWEAAPDRHATARPGPRAPVRASPAAISWP